MAQRVSGVASQPAASGQSEPLLRDLEVGREDRVGGLGENLRPHDPIEADGPGIEGPLSGVRRRFDEDFVGSEPHAVVPMALTNLDVSRLRSPVGRRPGPADHLAGIEDEDVELRCGVKVVLRIDVDVECGDVDDVGQPERAGTFQTFIPRGISIPNGFTFAATCVTCCVHDFSRSLGTS